MALFESGKGDLFGIDIPNTWAEFLDPAGIFHDGGQFGMDLFNLDDTSIKEEAARLEEDRIKKEAEAKEEAEYKDRLQNTTNQIIKYSVIIGIIIVVILIIKKR